MDLNLTAFDFAIDFSKPLSEKRRVLHFGCQGSTLSNIPSVHHNFFSINDTRSSMVIMHLNDLPHLSKDMRRCLFDLERCRRGISGMLLILPLEPPSDKTATIFEELQETFTKQMVLQPFFFAFETPQILDLLNLMVE
jgi:hypothetical protein